MLALPRKLSLLILAIAFLSLSGCLGASLSQQLAQSLIMHGADKIAANALEAQEREQEKSRRNIVLKDTVPDEYWGAFVTSSFRKITPQVEPLPTSQGASQQAINTSPTIVQSKLVKVEVWSLMLGEEKDSVLLKAQLMGATRLPPSNKWQHWQVANGAVDDETKQAIVFLIPPELGRLKSGQRAVVEIAGLGELNVARYAAN